MSAKNIKEVMNRFYAKQGCVSSEENSEQKELKKAHPRERLPLLFVIRSEALNGERIVFRRDTSVNIPTKYRGLTSYTYEEARELIRADLDPEGLQAAHLIKKIFNGRVLADKK